MQIISYTRVSGDDQILDPQQREINAHCARNGWKIVDRFSDVMSGGRAVRPGMEALVSRCQQGGVEAVVVVKLDRLGRSLLNVVTLIDRLAKMGTAIICISQGIDTRQSNPCGRVTYQILAAIAEFEKSLISERTKAGLAVARANGKILGKPSKLLPPPADRKSIVEAWLATGNGYEDLGVRLGGVSRATAWRIAKRIVPTLPAPEVEV